MSAEDVLVISAARRSQRNMTPPDLAQEFRIHSETSFEAGSTSPHCSFTAQLGRTWKYRVVACVYPRLVCGVIRTDL
jgi:hypothetical protein